MVVPEVAVTICCAAALWANAASPSAVAASNFNNLRMKNPRI
jgi:hypothetical protein